MSRILHYLPYCQELHPWGVERISQSIAQGIGTWDDVMVVASDILTPWKKDFIIPDYLLLVPSLELVPVFPIPQFWTKRFWNHFREIQEFQPEIVMTHTRFFLQTVIGGIIAKWLHIPWIHIEHGSGFVKGYPWYVRWMAWLFDWTLGCWVLRNCDRIVTISQAHLPFIAQFTNKVPQVIYNPVDYMPLPKHYNIVPHIGFVGRLEPLKGVDILVGALANIQQLDWQCTIVGDGSERASLEQLIQNFWLSDRIHCVGADDRANWFHRMDIVVNPSYQEGLPTTVVEAILAQCVVVATDVGGTREITNQDDLILIPAGDEQACARALVEALDQYQHLAGLSTQEVYDRFVPEATIRQYREMVDALVVG